MTGLFLTSLTLANFRSYRRTEIAADPRPIALFGPNGAGKTNILEALSLLSPGRGLRRATAGNIARRPDAPGWKIVAGLQAPDRAHEIETWVENGSARQVRIDSKAASQVALGRIAQVLWLIPAMDRLWTEGADGRRRFLDRMALSFDAGHAEAALAYEKAMRERNRLLRDQVQDGAWYGALESQMAEAGLRLHRGRLEALAEVEAAQARAHTAFPAAALALEQAEGEMPATALDLRTALADSRPRDLAAGRTLIGPHRADLAATYTAKDVAARDCSTGEQKALLISLILANARALVDRNGAPPLLLLDEVAAHLDATRRAALYDEICTLGAQAWMTGTGPELFDTLGTRAQVFEITEQDGLSQMRKHIP